MNALFTRTDIKGTTSSVHVGNPYSLSKRTRAQVTLMYQRASGERATAATYPNGNSSSKSQLLAHTGITHSF